MIAELKPAKEINTLAWDAIVQDSPQGSIFVASWYLNAITPGWVAICVYDKDKLQAIMPLWIRKKYSITYALQPTFAKYWGICFANQNFKNNADEISWKKKITDAIIAAIPKEISLFRYNFHPAFDYPLPFFHHGFELKLRLTYTIDLTEDYENIYKNFSGSVRNKINKAAAGGITIKEDNSLNHVLSLILENKKAGKQILNKKYFPVFEKLFQTSKTISGCFVLTAKTAENEVAASAIFLYDHNRTYFLLGVVAPKHKQSAAMPYLVAHAIKFAKQKGCNTFDFLGSMIEGIETFFRSFGSKPQPYTFIEKKKFPFTFLKK